MSYILKIIKLTLFFVVIALTGLYFSQTALVYPGAYFRETDPTLDPIIENVEISPEITAYKINAPIPSKKAIITFHGNADTASNQMLFLQNLNDSFDIFSFEYPGYARTKGTPSETIINKQAKKLLEYLENNRYHTFVYYGHSLGTGPAVDLCKTRTPKALILEAPFLSLADMAQQSYFVPKTLARIMLDDQYDSINTLQLTNIPNLLIMHGEQDEIIDFSQGVSLFEHAYSPNKIFRAYPNGGHNNLSNYNRQDLRDFLNSI